MQGIKAFVLVAISIVFMGIFFRSQNCLAQAAPPATAQSAPDALADAAAAQGDWDTFLSSIGGSKGASYMGAIVVLIQVILAILKSPLGAAAGPWKLLLITALTMFLGVTGLKIQGFDWQSSIMHSTTLASFQVFAHQLYKQLLENKNQSSYAPS